MPSHPFKPRDVVSTPRYSPVRDTLVEEVKRLEAENERLAATIATIATTLNELFDDDNLRALVGAAMRADQKEDKTCG